MDQKNKLLIVLACCFLAFGAGFGQITPAVAQEAAGQAATSIPACAGIQFERNLTLGSKGDDVKCLQAILNSDSETMVANYGAGSPGMESTVFAGRTKFAVIKFQNKYAAEILSPYGLISGTGFVGASTRAKLNKLIGSVIETAACGNLTCESGETGNCPIDCSTNPVCGNKICEKGEADFISDPSYQGSCPADCDGIADNVRMRCAATGGTWKYLDCMSGCGIPKTKSERLNESGKGCAPVCAQGNGCGCPSGKYWASHEEGCIAYAAPACLSEGMISEPGTSSKAKCCQGLGQIAYCNNSGECKNSVICTAKCGNGACDDKENKYNCAKDCKAETCVGAGEFLEGNGENSGKVCCSGLTKIFDQWHLGSDGVCRALDSYGIYCLKCGDKICGKGENKCNCPADCGTVAKCAAEGEYTSGAVGPEYSYDCCQGLTGFNPWPANSVGGGNLCYNAVKGIPACKAIGSRSEGWYYPNGDLLKYHNCAQTAITKTCTYINSSCCQNGKCIPRSNVNCVTIEGCNDKCEPICATCGDGVCSNHESKETCPADCSNVKDCASACKTGGYAGGYCKAWAVTQYSQSGSCKSGESNIGWTPDCTAAQLAGGGRACCCISNSVAAIKCANTGGVWNSSTLECTCSSGRKWCDDDGCQPIAVTAKPVIYLYPAKQENINIKLGLSDKLIAEYPDYDEIKGWNVTAYPDGRLVNKADGKEYSYLFWEADGYGNNYDMAKGFVIKGSETKTFLQNILAKIGLTPKEYNEFIVYWYPKMKDNPYNIIHFAGTEYTSKAILAITPQPDSLLRVFMVFKPANEKVAITPQAFTPFERNGFTVVEWGGSEIR